MIINFFKKNFANENNLLQAQFLPFNSGKPRLYNSLLQIYPIRFNYKPSLYVLTIKPAYILNYYRSNLYILIFN